MAQRAARADGRAPAALGVTRIERPPPLARRLAVAWPGRNAAVPVARGREPPARLTEVARAGHGPRSDPRGDLGPSANSAVYFAEKKEAQSESLSFVIKLFTAFQSDKVRINAERQNLTFQLTHKCLKLRIQVP